MWRDLNTNYCPQRGVCVKFLSGKGTFAWIPVCKSIHSCLHRAPWLSSRLQRNFCTNSHTCARTDVSVKFWYVKRSLHELVCKQIYVLLLFVKSLLHVFLRSKESHLFPLLSTQVSWHLLPILCTRQSPLTGWEMATTNQTSTSTVSKATLG